MHCIVCNLILNCLEVMTGKAMILTIQWKISSDKALKKQRFGNEGRISCVWLGVLCFLLLLLQNVTHVRVMFLLLKNNLKADCFFSFFFFLSACLLIFCQFFFF